MNSLFFHMQQLLPYGYRTAIFFALLASFYVFPVDIVRTAFIYIPTIWLASTTTYPYSISFWLAAAHGVSHQIFPFIDQNSVNVNHTPFPDVLIHYFMLGYSYYLFEHFDFSKTRINLRYVRLLQLIMFLGSFLNVTASIIWGLSELPFVYTSIFQALSTGCWVFTHVLFTTEYNPYYIPIGGITLAISLLNWFLFRSSAAILADAFVNRYFETLFIIPTWIYAAMN